MKRDLAELGYVFEWTKVDAQNYLLPQRRNRVYATGDVNSGQNAADYQRHMRETMEMMSSDALIPFELVFDEPLPRQPVHAGRVNDKLQEALEDACLKAQSQNIFIDASTSNSRAAEYNVNALTCVRPTHGIFSQKLQRFVTVSEMWTAQGMFKGKFANPAAVDSILEENSSLAQCLAGNAFASTCTQAKVIASLIHSQGWDGLTNQSNLCTADAEDESADETSSLDQNTSSQSGLRSVSVNSGSLKRASSSFEALPDETQLETTKENQIVQPAKENQIVQVQERKRLRRCYGKTNPSNAYTSGVATLDGLEELRCRNAKRKRGRPPTKSHDLEKARGSSPPKKRRYVAKAKVSREGKKPCISIWAKMKLFEDS